MSKFIKILLLATALGLFLLLWRGSHQPEAFQSAGQAATDETSTSPAVRMVADTGPVRPLEKEMPRQIEHVARPDLKYPYLAAAQGTGGREVWVRNQAIVLTPDGETHRELDDFLQQQDSLKATPLNARSFLVEWPVESDLDMASLRDLLITRISREVTLSRNGLIRKTARPNDSVYALQHHHELIQSEMAWDVLTAAPDVVVAILDTGMHLDHPDLAANLFSIPGEIPSNGKDDDGNGYIDDIHGWDFYYDDQFPVDSDGHGTHVAGAIGAVGNNATGVAGVCWDVNMLSIQVLNREGEGFTSDVIRALEYIEDLPVDLINASFGGYVYSEAEEQAFQRISSLGIWTIAAAGNEKLDTDTDPMYPMGYDNDGIISVAALDESGNPAGYSNFGINSVDIFAPGSSIYSTYLNGNYRYLSGTSLATAIVTGAAALVLQQENPVSGSFSLRDRILERARISPQLTNLALHGGSLELSAHFVDEAHLLPDVQPVASFVQADGGGEAELSVNIHGYGPATVTWYREGRVDPVGTGSSLVIGDLSPENDGEYYAIVTTPVGSSRSPNIRLYVIADPPIFVRHPASQALYAGQPLRLSSEVRGTGPFIWQWLKDGVPIPGANDPVFSLPSTTIEDTGAYALRVSNPFGSTVSRAAWVEAGNGEENTVAFQRPLASADYHDGFIQVLSDDRTLIALSRNGLDWDLVKVVPNEPVSTSLFKVDDFYIYASQDGDIFKTIDLRNWEFLATIEWSYPARPIAIGNDRALFKIGDDFVSVNVSDGGVATAIDTWLSSQNKLSPVHFNGTVFERLVNGTLWTSADGIIWQERAGESIIELGLDSATGYRVGFRQRATIEPSGPPFEVALSQDGNTWSATSLQFEQLVYQRFSIHPGLLIFNGRMYQLPSLEEVPFPSGYAASSHRWITPERLLGNQAVYLVELDLPVPLYHSFGTPYAGGLYWNIHGYLYSLADGLLSPLWSNGGLPEYRLPPDYWPNKMTGEINGETVYRVSTGFVFKFVRFGKEGGFEEVPFANIPGSLDRLSYQREGLWTLSESGKGTWTTRDLVTWTKVSSAAYEEVITWGSETYGFAYNHEPRGVGVTRLDGPDSPGQLITVIPADPYGELVVVTFDNGLLALSFGEIWQSSDILNWELAEVSPFENHLFKDGVLSVRWADESYSTSDGSTWTPIPPLPDYDADGLVYRIGSGDGAGIEIVTRKDGGTLLPAPRLVSNASFGEAAPTSATLYPCVFDREAIQSMNLLKDGFHWQSLSPDTRSITIDLPLPDLYELTLEVIYADGYRIEGNPVEVYAPIALEPNASGATMNGSRPFSGRYLPSSDELFIVRDGIGVLRSENGINWDYLPGFPSEFSPHEAYAMGSGQFLFSRSPGGGPQYAGVLYDRNSDVSFPLPNPLEGSGMSRLVFPFQGRIYLLFRDGSAYILDDRMEWQPQASVTFPPPPSGSWPNFWVHGLGDEVVVIEKNEEWFFSDDLRSFQKLEPGVEWILRKDLLYKSIDGQQIADFDSSTGQPVNPRLSPLARFSKWSPLADFGFVGKRDNRLWVANRELEMIPIDNDFVGDGFVWKYGAEIFAYNDSRYSSYSLYDIALESVVAETTPTAGGIEVSIELGLTNLGLAIPGSETLIPTEIQILDSASGEIQWETTATADISGLLPAEYLQRQINVVIPYSEPVPLGAYILKAWIQPEALWQESRVNNHLATSRAFPINPRIALIPKSGPGGTMEFDGRVGSVDPTEEIQVVAVPSSGFSFFNWYSPTGEFERETAIVVSAVDSLNLEPRFVPDRLLEVFPQLQMTGWQNRFSEGEDTVFLFGDTLDCVFHSDIGWIWGSQLTETGAWIWRPDFGWFWKPSQYPYLYEATSKAWLEI